MMLLGWEAEKKRGGGINRRTLSTSAPAFNTPAYDMVLALLFVG
jgi:hypothetical protein